MRMKCADSHYKQLNALAVCRVGLENQFLISRSLDLGLIAEAKQLQRIDRQLSWMLLQVKRLGNSTHYIWRTEDDVKVRPSHAANDDRVFSWDNPPATGHPGEDFNCRCWAEPIGDDEYANQTLITPINDNPDKWTNADFVYHYRNDKGTSVTLSEAGILGDVIEHYSETLGVYDRVNRQIIDKAKAQGEGPLSYQFGRSYPFGSTLDLLLGNGFFSLGDSVVKGNFAGDARKEKGYLVINGIITYNFSDKFRDPTSKVERLMEEENITREEAIARLGDSLDEYGIPYDILDSWKTKFNATVKVNNP